MLIFRGLTGNMLLGQFVGPFPQGLPDHQRPASCPTSPTLGGVRRRLLGLGADSIGCRCCIGVIGAVLMFVLEPAALAPRASAEQMEVEPLRAVRRQERRSSPR